MALHGTVSAYDGKMWDAIQQKWVTPTPEGLAYAAERSRPAAVSAQHERAELYLRVTTLQALPGHRTTRVLGVVTALAAASGTTAGAKGNDALNKGIGELLTQAQARGANAVLGLTSSTFGAGGGITSAFGGDAVGVLLLGTAAVVEVALEESA
jgi:uncharacterized protein YbjQ (UPF0145 family)